jgi:hypothetical protein
VVAETSPDHSGTLTLYRTNGTRLSQVPVERGVEVLAVAGSRIFIQTARYDLKAIRRNGTIESLGNLGASVDRRFAASPDGRRWIWSTSQDHPELATTTSTVHLAGEGMTARAVEDLSRPGTVLAPVSWTPQGAFVQYGPAFGHGGYFPFARANEWVLVEGSVHRLDPATQHLTLLPATFGCTFGDMAVDGTIVCFPAGGPYLRLVASSGTATTIRLATPRFAYASDAFCAPVAATCTVAGATGVGNGMEHPNATAPEQYGTDLVTTDGSISRFGPDGVIPAMGWQSWLPDGRLVLWRRPGAAGGPAGLYVLDTTGQGPFISSQGEPVGFLNAG